MRKLIGRIASVTSNSLLFEVSRQMDTENLSYIINTGTSETILPIRYTSGLYLNPKPVYLLLANRKDYPIGERLEELGLSILLERRIRSDLIKCTVSFISRGIILGIELP